MMPIVLMSLDQSTTCSGYAVFRNGVLDDSGKIKGCGDTSDKRITNMAISLLDVIKKAKPDEVILENIQMEYGNAHAFKILAQLQGALMLGLSQQNIPYNIVAPATWRSRLGWKKMKREEAKAYSVAWVQDKYQIDVENNDEADAICIGTAFLMK